jgi:3-dehydroquinate synthase
VFASSKFVVQSHSRTYEVSIGRGSVHNRAANDNSIFIVDAKVAGLHACMFPNKIISIEATEANKSLESIEQIVNQLKAMGCTRETTLIAAGGGIIQDLVTFASSCYMRGVSWVYCPTTMLGMVDSCLGGKSSINVGAHKNILGNFHPPQAVVIDTRFCDTLSPEQITEGLIEAAKICYATSNEAFDAHLLLAKANLKDPVGDWAIALIEHSLLAKKRFVEEDEFDQGPRLLLNLGHTFGHAIEGATSYKVSHGIAVGLGVLAAGLCSRQLGYASADQSSLNKLESEIRATLCTLPSWAQTLKTMTASDALECFLSDKKHSPSYLRLILFNSQGRPTLTELPRSDSTMNLLLSAFKHLKDFANEVQRPNRVVAC